MFRLYAIKLNSWDWVLPEGQLGEVRGPRPDR